MATVQLLRPALPDTADVSDGDLVLAARAGQQWAREGLFRRYSSLVYGLSVRLGGMRDAKDVTQDVFVEALRGLSTLQEPSFVRSWLCGITVRLVRRRLRRSRLVHTIFGRIDGDMEQAISRFAPPDIVADLRQLYRHVERLPERERVAFLLRRVERMSVEEAATAMSTSVSSLKRWVAAAEARIERATRDGRSGTQ